MGMCGPIGDGRRDDAAFEQAHGYDPRGPEPAQLAEGLIEKDGTVLYQCRVCERWVELMVDPSEFDGEVAYCGGSPRCIP